MDTLNNRTKYDYPKENEKSHILHPQTGVTPYSYQLLDRHSREIRLVTILPNDFHDDIRVQISHVPFSAPTALAPERMTLEEVQKTTPAGWRVYETYTSRYIFEKEDTEDTSWSHPHPGFDATRYDPASMIDPYANFQPAYEALSYTWGRSGSEELVYVEASSSTSATSKSSISATALHLRPSLVLALRHLRQPDTPRIMWIDAICINQEDHRERSEQVGRMGDIYRLARRVVIWLGPGTSDSGPALERAAYLGQQLVFCKGYYRLRSPNYSERDWFRGSCPLPYDDPAWQGWQDIIERPWFKRLWIVQEALLANEHTILQCGKDQISWSLFRQAVNCLISKKDLPGPEWRERLRPIYALLRNQADTDFDRLLLRTLHQECFEPRDRVYGLLGLTPASFSSLIVPDYSLPFNQVYKNAFLAYLQQNADLHLLGQCRLAQRQFDSPSWVPNWSLPLRSEHLGFRFLASGQSRCVYKYIESEMLEVSGVKCATIKTIGQVPHNQGDDICTLLREWQPSNIKTASYMTGESLIDAYVTTLCTGYIRERWPTTAVPTIQECKNSYSACVLNAGRTIASDIVNNNYIRRVRRWIKNMTFLTTEEYIGIGPSETQPGDLICVLLGYDAPLLLRPQIDGSYQVVGECYIHGLMDGECLFGSLPFSWILQRDIDNEGEMVVMYKNYLTGAFTYDDPRLGPLPVEWERLGGDNPRQISRPRFRHIEKGEVTNFDPRLAPECLIARGVHLQKFCLV